MSVPQNKRKESKLEVFVLARELCVYTLRITKNKNVFTEEYQDVLTNDIINKAKDIFIYCFSANNMYISNGDSDALKERNKLQNYACIQCNNLLALIQIAKPIFHLDSRRIAYWTNMIINTRNHIRAWMKSDKEKYK